MKILEFVETLNKYFYLFRIFHLALKDVNLVASLDTQLEAKFVRDRPLLSKQYLEALEQ